MVDLGLVLGINIENLDWDWGLGIKIVDWNQGLGL